jgi:hypothetical protein
MRRFGDQQQSMATISKLFLSGNARICVIAGAAGANCGSRLRDEFAC